jgi:O-methyltransferase
MTWKDTVNVGLVRLTGYQLARPVRGPSAKPQTGSARRAGGTVAKRAPVSAQALSKDYDDEAARTIAAVKPWTMTSPEKLNALILTVRHIAKHKIPGDIVECGVWRGGSMQATARTLLETGDTSRHLYLFDTFEGMPPPTEEDIRHDGRSAADLLATNERTSGVWAVASLEDVQDGMSHVAYPEDQIHFVPGLVEDTLPDKAPEQISVLRLDTDWYASTKHELETLYPRLVSGGVLLIDDYGWWQGSRQAVDEFLDQTGEQLLLLRMATGRIAVKP